MSDAELEQRERAARTHGAYAYQESGKLPARLLKDGFDVKLAHELLDHVGGDPAHRLLCQSAARRATLLEIVYSWLAREDIPVFWVEHKDGHKILKHQPILNVLGSWHEGLRRDLSELGLTPQAAAALGVPSDGDVLDAALEDAHNE